MSESERGKSMAVVLLIDDDVDMVEANKVVLENRGHDVCTAYSGAEARELLATQTPDAAVIDVMMETMSAGFDLAREIHSKFPDMPLLILSGVRDALGLKFEFEPDKDWLPIVKFLEKPVPPSDLADEVEALVTK